MTGAIFFQVFDVAVNQHTVIKGLDIYERVGRAVGHDEYIPFKVNNDQLLIDGETVPFGGSIYLEFLKVSWLMFFIFSQNNAELFTDSPLNTCNFPAL